MIFLSKISLYNFRNIKKVTLDRLSDINIFIGPNNIGKTNILKSISVLSQFEISSSEYSERLDPPNIREQWNRSNVDSDKRMNWLVCNLSKAKLDDLSREVEIVYDFNVSFFKDLLNSGDVKLNSLIEKFGKFNQSNNPKPIGDFSDKIEEMLKYLEEKGIYKLKIKKYDNLLRNTNFSAWAIGNFSIKLTNSIILCEEERLKTYKGKTIDKDFADRSFQTQDINEIFTKLNFIVDPGINDFRPTSSRFVLESGYESTVDEQGSGTRSMLCLLSDLQFDGTNKIILIDEPELGLNPKSKQLFLEQVIEKSKDNQIFIATHDPTFINPTLLKLYNKNERSISIFFYSDLEKNFIHMPMDITIEVASSFTGYLPHTTSKKDVHIYVEGRIDVQNIKELIYKYLWEKKIWIELEDRIDIYHLQGNLWRHFLSTIPPHPYRKIIILDGDKRSSLEVKDPLTNETLLTRIKNMYNVEFLTDLNNEVNISQAKKIYKSGDKIILYLLKRNNLDEYVIPPPASKKNGPINVHTMNFKDIDNELNKLFDFIFDIE